MNGLHHTTNNNTEKNQKHIPKLSHTHTSTKIQDPLKLSHIKIKGLHSHKPKPSFTRHKNHKSKILSKFEIGIGHANTSQKQATLVKTLNNVSSPKNSLSHWKAGSRFQERGGDSYNTKLKLPGSNCALSVNSSIFKADSSGNRQFRQNFTPLSKSEAMAISQNASLVRKFSNKGRFKPRTIKRYDQKLDFFCRDYLMMLPEFRDITSLSKLELALSENRIPPYHFERYIIKRAFEGKSSSTIEGDLSAIKALWKEFNINLQYVYPRIDQTMQAIKHTFGKKPKGSDVMRIKEVHAYFDLNYWGTPYERLHLNAEKIAFCFALRPGETYNLLEYDIQEIQEILDLNESRPMINVNIYDSKTCKNAFQSEHVIRPIDYQGFDLRKILQEIRLLRTPNPQNFLFYINKTRLTYDNGRIFFNKAIQTFKEHYPQYANKKYTPQMFRASQMCCEYKINDDILKKVKHSARHSQRSKTTQKVYLKKDRTLFFSQ